MKTHISPRLQRRIKAVLLFCALAAMSIAPSAVADVTLLGDTFVSHAAPTKNFGRAAVLSIVEGATDGHLRFDLANAMPSGTPGIAKATLKVFVSGMRAGTSGTLSVHESATINDELLLTGLTPLDVGVLITSATPTLNNWVAFDLTGYVAAHKSDPQLFFALRGTGGLNIRIDSKEGRTTSHAPTLEIVWDNVSDLILSANSNTAHGAGALVANTTGYKNTAHGSAALNANTEGSYNTASGDHALASNTTGTRNTAIGSYALVLNTTGINNTAIGYGALDSTTGSQNTAIGSGAWVMAGNLNNATVIGFNAGVNASNKVRIGNEFVTSIEGQVGWSFPSDRRYKSDIRDLPLGLDFITRLRPVEYVRNNNAAKTREWGIIAQELQQTLADVGYRDAGIIGNDSSPEKYLTVRYDDLLAPMIKAIQEQEKTIREQQKTIAELSKRIEALEKK